MHSAAVKSSITLPEIALPAFGLPAIFPGDVAGLTALLHEQHSTYVSAVESIRQHAMRAVHDYLIRMVEQAALARHRLYRASSEQTSPTLAPRQATVRWVIGASAVLQPLHNLLRDLVLDCARIHMNETVLQMFKEKEKAATSNSYIWEQTDEPPGRPVVLYDYDPCRSGAVPARLLDGYQGYLMTDGCEGYYQVASTDGVELAQRDATDGQRLLARRVLRDLPAAKTVDDVEALLPWRITAQSNCQFSLSGVTL